MIVSQGFGGARLEHELAEEAVSLGRGDDNDIVLDHRTVSRRHARISWDGIAYVVEDLGSKNGTWVNDRRIEEMVALRSGDLVRFGDVGFLFDDPGDSTVTIPDLAALSSGATEGPPARADAPEGTVTILFTDIADSTAIGERLGDRRWLEVLRMHNAIVREQMRAHGGYEVKTAGDGFMVAFTSARRGLQCAIGVQRALVSYNHDHPDHPLAVRIGLHTGEPVREADDFYGWHVNLASRIAATAQGGEILVSSLLKGLVESSGDITFSEPREVQLKGVSGIQCVFSVAWQ